MTLVKSNKSGNFFPTLLSDFFDNDKFLSNKWFEKEYNRTVPAVNVKENKDSFSIEFAAPGFKKGDFNINVDENVLTISAEKQEEAKEDNEEYTRREFSYSSFSRSFTLPQSVNPDKIDAKYSEGILHLIIPKKEEAKKQPKKEIKVS
jgi:HSP20 family protein